MKESEDEPEDEKKKINHLIESQDTDDTEESEEN